MARTGGKGVVIAWMPASRRSESLANRLDFDLVLFARQGFRRPWSAPLAYPTLAFRTIRELARRRPRAVIIVAPPFVAPALVFLLAPALHARVAVDIHSGALLDRRWRWSVPVLRFVCRHSRAAIVTLESLVGAMGGAASRTIVLPDPLPDLARVTPEEMEAALRPHAAVDQAVDVDQAADSDAPDPSGRPNVVVMAGWGDDEPLDEVAAAAAGRPWNVFITGRRRRELPNSEQVNFTGFVTDREYAAALMRADVLVALTTRDQTLLSGAWEAISLHKALVLSDTSALHEAFEGAAVFARPTVEGIRAGIAEALARRTELESAAAGFAARKEAQTVEQIEALSAALR